MGVGIVRISPEFAFQAIKQKSADIPNGGRMRNAGYDVERGCFYVFLEHPDIKSVPEGSILPVITPTLLRTE